MKRKTLSLKCKFPMNMKKCAFCEKMIVDRQKTAKYCSDLCRLKAFRLRNGIPEPFTRDTALNEPQNEYSYKIKSFTCCENGRFYSPVAKWGEVLICDNCGAVWERKK